MTTHVVFGHGIGYETLPPQMLGDRKAIMEVRSNVDNVTHRKQISAGKDYGVMFKIYGIFLQGKADLFLMMFQLLQTTKYFSILLGQVVILKINGIKYISQYI